MDRGHRPLAGLADATFDRSPIVVAQQAGPPSPVDAPAFEDAIGQVSRTVVGCQLPLATRAEIATALDLPVPTIAASLKAMVQAGLLTTDPPIEEARRGQWVRYGVDQEVVSRMYLQLGQAIGEV